MGYGAKVARVCFLLLLVSIASLGHAQTSPIGFPTISCIGNAPPIAPGAALGMPGRWGDPKRAGTGWDLIYTSDQSQLIVQWYSFDLSHRPVWLQSGLAAVNTATGQWAAPLNKVTWSQAANSGNGGTVTTQVGTAAIQFTSNSATRAGIRWSWSDVTGSATSAAPDECINDSVRDFPSTPAK